MLKIDELKKKTLLATPIDASKEHLFKMYADGVNLQSCDVLLIDTTDNNLYKNKALKYNMFYETLHSDKMMDVVVNARQFAIDYAKAHDKEYIFFIDSDIVLDDDILTTLLCHDKLIVSAVYWSKSSDGKRFIVHNLETPMSYRRMKRSDLNTGLLQASQIAFGCVLIKLSVFDDLKIRCERDSEGKLLRGEDYCFSNDIYVDKGWLLFVDSNIIVSHYPTNEWLDGDV